MNAEEAVKKFKDDVENFVDGEVFHQGSVIGVLEKACGGKENRYLLLKALTGKTSSKLLTHAEWYALCKLVLPYKPQNGHWTTQHGENDLHNLCGAILTRFWAENGQISMFPPPESSPQP